jgi:hypothetical protein
VRPWLRVALATLGFWALWVGVAGLAMTVHGDCGLGATEVETAACVRDKGRVGLLTLAIGAIGYGLMVWRIAGGRRRR